MALNKFFLLVLIIVFLSSFSVKAEEKYFSPEDIEEIDDSEIVEPNPYVLKKDISDLEDEFDKPDLLSKPDDIPQTELEIEAARRIKEDLELRINKFSSYRQKGQSSL